MNRGQKPPRMSRWLLFRFSSSMEKRSICGDMDEEYTERVQHRNGVQAGWWYACQVAVLVPAYCIHGFYWSLIMFTNAIKIAGRAIKRNTLFSMVNILGLAVALGGG